MIFRRRFAPSGLARTHASRVALVVICLLFVVIPPTLAFAWSNFNYASGTAGLGGSFPTPGYAPREYNRVWHAQGYEWWVWYSHPDGSVNCFRDNFNNPTACGDPNNPIHDSYAKSYCTNYGDSSGVLWTCQTTQP